MAKCPTSFIICCVLLFSFLLIFSLLSLLFFVEVTLTSFCSTLFLSFIFLFFLIQLIMLTESPIFITFSFLFHITLFIPTFSVITHNSQPQLMTLPWIKVRITQGWVLAKTRLVSVLSTLNFGFLPEWRCKCPRRHQG